MNKKYLLFLSILSFESSLFSSGSSENLPALERDIFLRTLSNATEIEIYHGWNAGVDTVSLENNSPSITITNED